ncbi:asparagine synthase-related protein [Halocatena halophila]|uniref:asparagine synthase-related protein n=1 Tax=Halocatena halophila TaxID=2814576 RepID=UPI002ED56D40
MTYTLRTQDDAVASSRKMNKELFGCFGDRSLFDRHRNADTFDTICSTSTMTVGIRDPGLAVDGRSSVYDDGDGFCCLWGEVYPRERYADDELKAAESLAEWLFGRFDREGIDAVHALNGSFLAVFATDEQATVVTDPVRSWECFYTDIDGDRLFSTDLAVLTQRRSSLSYRRDSLLEYIHLGTVLGERTLLQSIDRVPFDGYLNADHVGELDRFVYEPTSFDYARELSERLVRAVDRRATSPDPAGLLLSGGHDSRIFLTEMPSIAESYTIGNPNSREVTVAQNLAGQYDVSHTVLQPDERYLLPTDEKSRYTQGIKEALHIHHAGFNDTFEMESVYHGTLFDTLFKGYFLERDGLELFGMKLPSKGLAPDPDPIDSLLNTLGFFPAESERVAEAAKALFDVDLTLEESPTAFLRSQLEAELETCWERTESVHNAMDLLVIKNQPVMPMHVHLADNYYEGFVAIDSELLDWHLKTPPEYRRYDTFRKAVGAIDDDILKHRPQSQPLGSVRLNQIQRFLRRKVPLLEAFEPAWPPRDELYDRYRLDESLFPDDHAVRGLPARLKLRIHDARWWMQ